MSDCVMDRNWVFTVNNYSPDDEAKLQGMGCRYMVYGREVAPTTGTPHLQGFVAFKSARRWTALRKELDCYWKPSKDGFSNYVHAIEYCKKEGDFFEKGLPLMTQQQKGDTEKERWAGIISMARKRDYATFAESEPQVFATKLQAIMTNVERLSPPLRSLDVLDNYWYYGVSGTGKSRRAREEAPDAYIKHACNKWWDHYEGQDDVIIDDYRDPDRALAGQLLNWADHYPFPVEFKGGSKKIRPRRIIVTSNFHPRDLFKKPELVEPMMRRFNVIQVGDAYVNEISDDN